MTRARATGLLTFWTMTAWRDAAAMHRYLVTGAHGRVMARAKHWFDEASVARWLSDSPHADWSDIEERLATLGRLVNVDAPSPAQLAANPLGSSGTARGRRRQPAGAGHPHHGEVMTPRLVAERSEHRARK